MASLNVYSVGKLAKYISGPTLRTLRANVYRSTVRGYSTEEKSKAEPEAESKLPGSIEECHKQIETLTNDLNTLRNQARDYEVADTLAAAAESVPESEVSEGGAAGTEAGAAAALRSLHDGVRLTRAQLTQVFSRHGLVSVSPLREKFDPNLHEALFQQEVEGAEPGTVVAVSKVGYKLHERCVRPALVGVAK
ncbi:hypothetical protein HF086_006688 [Spodoptera exigua]|uniref:GrpE protein homolog n=1 Tax=Spodoptera exigua TaxID=7107 RepID=A0A922MZG9_SPOEX|nr:hypothetical protein HF086_006688 [Spodoptera exigua]